LEKTKKHKALGLSGILTEMLHAISEIGVDWLTELGNSTVNKRRMPNTGNLVPVYNDKGSTLVVCG